MGAYGSPELPPNDRNNTYDYGYGYHKKKRFGFLRGLLAFVGTLFVFFVLFAIVYGNKSSGVKDGGFHTMASAPVYSVPASSAPVIVDDSRDYLQSWAKAEVLTCLLYPDSAKFSEEPTDWKIVRDSNECTISSNVWARGKKSKQLGMSTFVVKISYKGLNAEVTYISIDDKVCYDISKTKSSK